MKEKEEHLTRGTPELVETLRKPMENARHSKLVPPLSEIPDRGISK